ncbi:MAG: SpoIIE family protein phosphatase [Bacteroidota bacterium]
MKFRFTIGRKIGTGFGVIIFAIAIVFIVQVKNASDNIEVVNLSQDLDDKIDNVYNPSLQLVDSLQDLLVLSKNYMEKWANEESKMETWKLEVTKINEKTIPAIGTRINNYKKEWPKKEIEIIDHVFQDLDTLLGYYKEVRITLPDLASYKEAINTLTAQDLVNNVSHAQKIYDRIQINLKDLAHRQTMRLDENKNSLAEVRAKSKETTRFLFNLLIILGIALVIGTLLIATFTTRSIVRPVQSLKRMLLMLGKGIIPKHKLKPTNDEIGDMSVALNGLIDGFQRTTEFSRQVGIGNFNYNYEPLSEDDVLGHALLKMRDDLAENERILEQKVIERTEEVVRQKEEIEKQRQKLEELYKDVTDSIRYAKRLQESILPPDAQVKKMLPESFVLYKPKDIVSGDFYWFHQKEKNILFAAVDCTGHGVPGAFMSLVGANALNQAVKEHGLSDPGKILDDLNKLSSEALNKHAENNSVRDGMDLAFCTFNTETLQLQYAGANNPLYVIRGNEIISISADKFAIGAFEPGSKHYKTHHVQLQKEDRVYVFSDGYADQFGGKKGKKFMYKRFREMLLEIKNLPMEEQKIKLNEAMEKWRGPYEQIDDILIIGVKIG